MSRQGTFSNSQRGYFSAAASFLTACLLGVSAQAAIFPDGGEYRLADVLPGDQSRPDMALAPNGGYLVWEDNYSDGDGLSVNLRRVNSALSGEFEVTALATRTAGNQQNPRVTLLTGGGAAFVWQGGPVGKQQVFLRVMRDDGTFVGDEIAVSSRVGTHQIQPSVAGLADGNIVVAWGAFDVDNVGDQDDVVGTQGVFAALFDSMGARIGDEFRVNQFTRNNQRNAVVSALPSGKFVVGWISEGQRNENSVDVYARLFNTNGSAVASEFRVNNGDRVASSPAITKTLAGGYTLVWAEAPYMPGTMSPSGFWTTISTNLSGWDIYGCTFSEQGKLQDPQKINQYSTSNQRSPSVATVGSMQLVIWNSYAQDGNRYGIVGRTLNSLGAPEGNEFVVNTTTHGRQEHGVARANGDSHFAVAWVGFTGIAPGTELFGQRYRVEGSTAVLPTPPAPVISALSANRVSVTWPEMAGYPVASYEVYAYVLANGSSVAMNPLMVTNQIAIISGLAPSQSISVEIAYRLNDGMLSPRSPAATGKSWGDDVNGGEGDGLPDDWQMKYWGVIQSQWASPSDDSDGDGVSNRNEFLAGTDPKDANSVLRTKFLQTSQGWRLSWNSNPGFIYQVQRTTDFTQWENLGGQRFSPGTTDSVSVPLGNSLGYYRVIRIR